MSKEMERAKTLEERINDKLRESLADLMTPEDLRGIVERGVENLLFKERVTQDGRGWAPTTRKPPLVEELVSNHLEKQVREAVQNWIAENPERLQEAVDNAMRRGIANAVMRTMDERFAGIFNSGVSIMQSQGILPSNPQL